MGGIALKQREQFDFQNQRVPGRGCPTSYRVESRTLDSVLNDLGVNQVDVLKIDVEGAEMGVLRGAREMLSRCRPTLMVELDDQLLATMDASSDEVKRFLASFGYRPTGLFDDANVLFTSE